jgi:hypothetical protein
MDTLLLLLATASGPAWGQHYPPSHPPLGLKVAACYRRFGMAISGVKCTYGGRKVPVSPGPTPAYVRYFQPPPHPPATAPAPK